MNTIMVNLRVNPANSILQHPILQHCSVIILPVFICRFDTAIYIYYWMYTSSYKRWSPCWTTAALWTLITDIVIITPTNIIISIISSNSSIPPKTSPDNLYYRITEICLYFLVQNVNSFLKFDEFLQFILIMLLLILSLANILILIAANLRFSPL